MPIIAAILAAPKGETVSIYRFTQIRLLESVT
jgi:hypothetical protein